MKQVEEVWSEYVEDEKVLVVSEPTYHASPIPVVSAGRPPASSAAKVVPRISAYVELAAGRPAAQNSSQNMARRPWVARMPCTRCWKYASAPIALRFCAFIHACTGALPSQQSVFTSSPPMCRVSSGKSPASSA